MGRAVGRALCSPLADSGAVDTSLEAREFEVLRLPPDGAEFNSLAYMPFRKRLDRAAQAAGFRPKLAAGFAGAFYEMADNVYQHSDLPCEALVAYRWEPGEFEFVVADAGVGVLASLRKSVRYRHLSDSGTAMKVAIREGESSIDPEDELGRGRGFTILLTSLANLNGFVHLRSGDHKLDLDGQDLLGLPDRVARTSEFRGLLVAVRCRPSVRT